MKTIVLIFLHGGEEKVRCQYWRVKDGYLMLEVSRDEWRHFPLTALREWRVTE